MSKVTLTVECSGIRTTREFDSANHGVAGEAFAKAMEDAGGLTWPMFTTVVDAMVELMTVPDGDPLSEPVSMVMKGCDGIDEYLGALKSLRTRHDPPPIEPSHDRDFVCKVCSATPDYEGCVRHGKGCFVLSEDGGGEEWVQSPALTDAERKRLMIELADMMSDWSEDTMCAGWLCGLEEIAPAECFRVLNTPRGELPHEMAISVHQAKKMVAIAERLGHWVNRDYDAPSSPDWPNGIPIVPYTPKAK